MLIISTFTTILQDYHLFDNFDLYPMFTIRTVPARREYDDARPTSLRKVGKKQLAIYSGKIPTCVDVADKVLRVMSGENLP